jgi:hypothetical protein
MSTPKQKAKNMKFIFAVDYKPSKQGSFMKGINGMAKFCSIFMFLINTTALIFTCIDRYDQYKFINDDIGIINIINFPYQVILWFFVALGTLTNNFKTCYYVMFFVNLSVFIETILAVIFLFAAYNHTMYSNYYQNLSYQMRIGGTIEAYYCLFIYSSWTFFWFTKDLGKKTTENDELLDHTISENLGYIPPNSIASEIHVDETNYHSSLDTPDSSKIVLIHPQDLTFAQNSQNAVVNDAVLPSGMRVPSGVDGKAWRVVGNEIMLI